MNTRSSEATIGWANFKPACCSASFNRSTLAERRSRNGEALGNAIEGIEGIDTTEPDERITTHAYHLFVMRYSAAAFNGLSRDHFIEALNAEGIPCSAGYRPLYGEPAFTTRFAHYPLDSPYYEGRPDYGQVHCPVTERVCAEEAIWLTQNLLLGRKAISQTSLQP